MKIVDGQTLNQNINQVMHEIKLKDFLQFWVLQDYQASGTILFLREHQLQIVHRQPQMCSLQHTFGSKKKMGEKIELKGFFFCFLSPFL